MRTERPLLSTRFGGRALAAMATAMLSIVALSGCTLVTTLAQAGGGSGGGSSDPTDPVDVIDADLSAEQRAYYEQELDWSSCEGAFECTTATAPIDWDDPSKGEIELAMLKVPATGNAIGTLFLNPGGPGGSGVEFASYAGWVFGDDVLRNYDIVGWDPRGVGASSSVSCLTPEERDDFYYPEPDPAWNSMTEAEQIAQMTEEAVAFGELCLERTGPLLEFVDTLSTVRDLDMLRATVGDERLAYIGFSYGTYIGAIYADTFPERVGRVVLDGAIDPSLPQLESSLAQQQGFVDATRSYIEDCLTGVDCPFSGSYDDAITQINDLMDAVDVALPKNSDGRTLTSSVIDMAITSTMYSEASWPSLTQAFTMYEESGDPSGFFALSDSYYDRNPDGTYNGNLIEAFIAINCMDAPAETDESVIKDYNEASKALDPFSRPGFETVGDLTCQQWPFQSRATVGPVSGTGAAPLLVVGTTGDPATPYVEAVALAEQLESATLVTYEGEGHTAYGQDPCVNRIIDDYLVDGIVPDSDPTC